MALTKVSRGLLSTSIVDNGNATAITIDANENVGIGTSSPSNTLHVQTSSSGATPFSSSALVIERSDVNLISMLSANDTDQGILFGDVADNDIGGLFYLHASNAMTFRTNTAERMRIASDGGFSLSQGTGNNFRVIRDGDNTIEVGNYSATDGYRSTRYISSTHTFFVASAGAGSSSRAVDIDSSGNLLVGTTNVNQLGITLRGDSDYIYVARNEGITSYFDRKSTDGAITEFRKDGTPVGNIGTYAGDLTIGDDDVGIRFDTGVGLVPWDLGANSTGGAATDGAIDIGAASARFKDLYRSGSTISTSDRNLKQDIRDLTDAERNVAVAAKGLLKAFRFIDRVEEEGASANIHFGIIAQDLAAAFTAEGLDANDYQVYRADTFTDDDGNEQTRLGICYENLLAFIIAAI